MVFYLKYEKEILRQIIHSTGIIFIILEPILGLRTLILLTISTAIIGELIYQVDRKRYIPFFSWVLKNCRRDNAERGFIYYFLGLALVFSIFGFDTKLAGAVIIILTLGDATSTIIGKIYGEHPLPYNPNKTFEGSIAFIIVGFIGALTQVNPLIAFIGALVGALVEAYTPIEDNLTIPLIAGGAMYISSIFMK